MTPKSTEKRGRLAHGSMPTLNLPVIDTSIFFTSTSFSNNIRTKNTQIDTQAGPSGLRATETYLELTPQFLPPSRA